MRSTYSINARLPFLVFARDYHELGDMEYFFRLLQNRVRVKEIAFDENSGKCVGVVYIGRKPLKADLKKMLEKASVAA